MGQVRRDADIYIYDGHAVGLLTGIRRDFMAPNPDMNGDISSGELRGRGGVRGVVVMIAQPVTSSHPPAHEGERDLFAFNLLLHLLSIAFCLLPIAYCMLHGSGRERWHAVGWWSTCYAGAVGTQQPPAHEGKRDLFAFSLLLHLLPIAFCLLPIACSMVLDENVGMPLGGGAPAMLEPVEQEESEDDSACEDDGHEEGGDSEYQDEPDVVVTSQPPAHDEGGMNLFACCLLLRLLPIAFCLLPFCLLHAPW